MATKKIEVDASFIKAVLACGTTCYADDIDATACNAFNILKKNKIKPYCKYASYDDFISNEGE